MPNFKRLILWQILIAIIILNTSLIGILVSVVCSILVNQNALQKQLNNINGMYTLIHLKLCAGKFKLQ